MGENSWVDVGILLLMILLSGWAAAQFTQLQGRSVEAGIANAYQNMGIVALLVLVGAYARVGFLDFTGFERSFREVLPYLFVGGAVGYLITAQGHLQLIQILAPGSIDPTLGFIFVNILAAFVETYFFWGALYPSLKRFIGGKAGGVAGIAIAALAVSLLFATFHIVAAQGDQSRLIGEVLFSLLMIALLELTHSLVPPIAAHFVRNLVTGG